MSPRTSSAGISGGAARTSVTDFSSMPERVKSFAVANWLADPGTMPIFVNCFGLAMSLRTTSFTNCVDCV